MLVWRELKHCGWRDSGNYKCIHSQPFCNKDPACMVSAAEHAGCIMET